MAGGRAAAAGVGRRRVRRRGAGGARPGGADRRPGAGLRAFRGLSRGELGGSRLWLGQRRAQRAVRPVSRRGAAAALGDRARAGRGRRGPPDGGREPARRGRRRHRRVRRSPPTTSVIDRVSSGPSAPGCARFCCRTRPPSILRRPSWPVARTSPSWRSGCRRCRRARSATGRWPATSCRRPSPRRSSTSRRARSARRWPPITGSTCSRSSSGCRPGPCRCGGGGGDPRDAAPRARRAAARGSWWSRRASAMMFSSSAAISPSTTRVPIVIVPQLLRVAPLFRRLAWSCAPGAAGRRRRQPHRPAGQRRDRDALRVRAATQLAHPGDPARRPVARAPPAVAGRGRHPDDARDVRGAAGAVARRPARRQGERSRGAGGGGADQRSALASRATSGSARRSRRPA